MGFKMKGLGNKKVTDNSHNMTPGATAKMNDAVFMQYTSPISQKQQYLRDRKVVSGRKPGEVGAGAEYAGETTVSGRVIPEEGFRRGDQRIISVGPRQRTGSKQGVGDTREIIYEKEGGMSTYITPEGRYHADDVSTEDYRKGYGRLHTAKQKVRTHVFAPGATDASEKGYAPVWDKAGYRKVAGSRGYKKDGYVIEGEASRITPRKGASTKPTAKVLMKKSKKYKK